MTKTIKHKGIMRDEYDGHILTCDACGLPFFQDEWDDRHECTNDPCVYHAYCCPVCNPNRVNDIEMGL